MLAYWDRYGAMFIVTVAEIHRKISLTGCKLSGKMEVLVDFAYAEAVNIAAFVDVYLDKGAEVIRRCDILGLLQFCCVVSCC